MTNRFTIALLALGLALAPAPGQLNLGGGSQTTLDVDIWKDPIVGIGLTISGSAPPGSLVAVYVMDLGAWPIGPVLPLAFLPASPAGLYGLTFLLPNNVNAGPLVIAAVATSPTGVQVSPLKIAHVRVAPACIDPPSGRFFVGRNEQDIEMVRIKVYACPGNVITVRDPSGTVRAQVTITAAQGPFVFDQPNDFPGNAGWSVGLDTGAGLQPFLGG